MSTILVGTVVSGTLRNQDLLPAFLDELARVDMGTFMKDDFRHYVPEYAMEDHTVDWWESEEAYDMVNWVMGALNDAAPEGYYFGAHPDDGAAFGWWEIEDE